MLRIEPEIVQVDIVLVGDFNPAIFSPRWFSAHGLIRESAADGAELGVVHQEVADFKADWLRIQVTQNRFVAASSQAPFERLRDLVHRTFREHLFHTPLRAIGINFAAHFLVDSLATRDRIGSALAPLEPWGPWRGRLNLDSPHGGMTSLRMSQTRPSDREEGGRVNVVIEPSARVGQESGRGVFVSINDHFAGKADSPASVEKLMAILAAEFEGSLGRSEGIVDHIMSLADTSEG